jgi:hypothetical protein
VRAAGQSGWNCTFTSPVTKEQLSATYRIEKGDIVQTWRNGMNTTFHIVENNKYGLIGIASMSEMEAGKTTPTVGAMTVVIDKGNKKFWLSSEVNGQPGLPDLDLTGLVQGTCLSH